MKKYTLLFLILVLAFVTRFYKLGEFPAINADEAAIGYNTYSLIQTGKDEHGNPWPIHFQSFNDYKPGLYVYIVLPFVRLLGLNEWAVRIPGTFLGVATVLVVYFLVKELFGKKKLALVAGLLLAISPWHIHFSRGGWEVNVACFFITTGVWLFIKSTKNPKYYLWSVISFAASLYTYHSARVVVPLMGLGLVVFYRKELIEDIKRAGFAALVGLLLVTPLLISLTSPVMTSRATGVSILSDSGPLNKANEQRGEHENYSSSFAKIFHNKPVNYGLVFLSNWVKHFDGEFLFNSGDTIQRNKVPDMGLMYLFEAVTVVIGFIVICKDTKKWRPILWWVLVAPVAAAFTFQSPHALRAQNMVIPLTIISAFGLVTIVEWMQTLVKSNILRKVGYSLIVVVVAWSFARYEHLYWVHMTKEYPFSSQYGVKELVSYLQKNGERYKKIIVTDRYDQPYILFLFYGVAAGDMKYTPKDFQNDHELTGRDRFGFSTVAHFGKYDFRSINFDTDQPENPGSLIIGTTEEVKAGNVIETIYGTNGYPYFKVVEN